MNSHDFYHPQKREELQNKVIPFRSKKRKPSLNRPSGVSGAQIIVFPDHHLKMRLKKHPASAVEYGKFSGWIGVLALFLVLALLLAL